MFFNRRSLITGAGALALAATLASCDSKSASGKQADSADSTGNPTANLYPAKHDPDFTLKRSITKASVSETYNNYYEFGTEKEIYRAAQALPIQPWSVSFEGMVEKPFTVDVYDLIRKMPLEERLYRHRCVEAWAMAVPWTGFPMKKLVEFAKPLSGAKFVQMQTFMKPDVAAGQRQPWYPWPYTEGLTMAEAMNDMAFMVTGVYGKPLPKQMGSPLRLAVPWKYGFKSVKAIVKVRFQTQQPKTYWQEADASEYGFWANVNPDVPHPRWSQANERLIGTGMIVPTQLFNGYAEKVAYLYKDMKGLGDALYR